MKLAPLLAQYLYTNKRLDLPGFGTFLFDSGMVTEPDSKQGNAANMQGVTFENNAATKETSDLINFISSQTGKIKALAAADLESYLELAQQFLNIGKPFLLEGIGNLVKIKSGQFAFTAGQIMPESMKEYSAREISSTSSTEESFSDHKNIFNLRKARVKWKKPMAFLLVLTGIGLALWGGYTIYKKTKTKNSPVTALPDDSTAKEEKKEETVVVTDTAKYLPGKIDSVRINDSIRIKDSIRARDSAAAASAAIKPATGVTKFILETAAAKRAFDRFAQLKAYQWNLQMETKDSVMYKLFMLLPAAASDTSRIKDSLTVVYGKKVYIEK